MNEVPSYRVDSDRKSPFWKLTIIWTAAHFVTSSLMMLLSSELVRKLQPALVSLKAREMLVVSFFAPPILTIWGIGITALSYKCRMMCAVPTSAIMASYLISVLFRFPLSTFFSIAAMIVMVYTPAKNMKNARVPKKLIRSQA